MFLSPGYRLVILALIVGSVLFLSFHPLKESQYSPLSDEGYYYRYALLVENKGMSGFHQLLTWYGSSDEARLHPSPFRAGYIIWLALLFKIFGPSYSILGVCSTVSFLIFLLVCFYYARKYFNPDIALLYVLLLSSSPLLLGLSRRALSDSPMNMLWGALAWMFLDFLNDPQKKKYLCIILLSALSITVKESIIVPMLFFVIIGISFKKEGAKISWFEIAGIIFWPLLIAVIFYSLILGGFPGVYSALSAILKSHLGSNRVNFYAIYFTSGPWFRYILDFLLLNPVVTLLTISFMGYLMARRDLLTSTIRYFLSYFIFVYTFFSLFPHRKLIRFVLNLEMVMGLFALLMLMEIFKPQDTPQGQRNFILAIVGIVLLNGQGFLQLFYIPGLLDPITYHLLVLRQFIPNSYFFQ